MSVVCVVEIFEAHSPRNLLLNHTHTQLCPTLCDPMNCSLPGSSVHGFSKQEYWMGCHFPLQRIFLTQGLNPRLVYLLHLQADSLPLSHLRSPNLTYFRKKAYTGKGVSNFYFFLHVLILHFPARVRVEAGKSVGPQATYYLFYLLPMWAWQVAKVSDPEWAWTMMKVRFLLWILVGSSKATCLALFSCIFHGLPNVSISQMVSCNLQLSPWASSLSLELPVPLQKTIRVRTKKSLPTTQSRLGQRRTLLLTLGVSE